MKLGMKKLFAWVLILCMVLVSAPGLAYAQSQEKKTSVTDGELVMEYEIVSEWENSYNIAVKLTNNGSEPIENWSVVYDSMGEIETMWNATVVKNDDNKLTVKNAGWNQDIAAGQSVTYGYILKCATKYMPTQLSLLNAKKNNVAEEKFVFSYVVYSAWENGMNANISITNQSGADVEDWAVEFDYPNVITEIWNAEVVEHTNNHYVIKNAGYNQNIVSGSAISFGFLANPVDVDAEPENIRLTELSQDDESGVVSNTGVSVDKSVFATDEETGMYYLNKELDMLTGTLEDAQKAKKGYFNVKNMQGTLLMSGEFLPSAQFVINDFGFVLGENVITVGVEYQNGKRAEETFSVMNYNEENMKNVPLDLEDTDGEGLNNYLESLYGTDKDKADTDGDGLSDYMELAEIGTNPLIVDTDGNGISDAEEDSDGDGLSNAAEVKYGTMLYAMDSDLDGLTDGEEVERYGTNPLSADTDGDGASDKWEVQNGHNPRENNSNFEVNADVDMGEISFEIKVTANGANAESFRVVPVTNTSLVNSTIPGYMGNAIDLTMDGQFEKAELVCYFDESYLEDETFVPAFYYINEETQLLEELPIVWDGKSNFFTVELEHFSKYIMLNKTAFLEVWENEIKAPTGENGQAPNLNIVFVMDLSGSMSGSKLRTMKNSVNSFIDVLGEKDRAALVTFTSSASILSGLTNDKDALKDKVDAMGAYGLTSIYKGVEKATQILSDAGSGYNLMIVFTDGYDEPSTTYAGNYASIVEEAVDNNIVIHTIGIQTVDKNLLTRVAEETGGNYYYAENVGELQEKVEEVREQTVDYITDSNNDGITDYLTKKICDGTIRTGTGCLAFTYADYRTVQNNDDYDGDGIINGDEIEVKVGFHGAYVLVHTNVEKADTDGDGIRDGAEKNLGTDPNRFNISVGNYNWLGDDGIFCSSLVSEEFAKGGWLATQLYLGNGLFNFKTDFVRDYKVALLEYIATYSEAALEDEVLEAMKAMYESDLRETMASVSSGLVELGKIEGESSEYYKALNNIKTYQNELDICKTRLARIDSFTDVYGFDDELRQIYLNITRESLELESKLSQANRIKKNTDVIEGLTDRVGKICVNVPSRFNKAMELLGKGGDILGYAGIVIETGGEVYDTVQLYSSLSVEAAQYAHIIEMLDAIVMNSENTEMRLAAMEVRMILESDVVNFLAATGDIMDEIKVGASQATLTAALASMGPMGFAIDLGLAFGTFIANTGELAEKSLATIAMGDAASAYAEYVKSQMVYNTEDFYYMNDANYSQFQLLGQLRINGENSFCETLDSRGVVLKLIEKLKYGSQKEAETHCNSTIDNVVDVCNKVGVYVTRDYEGAYLK